MDFNPTRLYRSFTRPVDAVPIDLFRISAALVVFAYFLRTLFEAQDFSAPGGLTDHDLTPRTFWFTRMGVFNAGMSLSAFHLIFCMACLCCVSVAAGYR